MLDIQLYTGPVENRLCSCINGNKGFESIGPLVDATEQISNPRVLCTPLHTKWGC